MPDPARPGDPRVDYDVPHGKPWGIDMVLYLFFKAIATGAMLVAALLWSLGIDGPLSTIAAPALSIVFITLTAVVLVVDLERPERFYYILTRSNFRSWMVWGAYLMSAHGAASTLWLAAGWFGSTAVLDWLALPAAAIAVLATSYTGFLFAQGLARDLWQGPMAAIDLVVQSVAAGSATVLIAAVMIGGSAAERAARAVLDAGRGGRRPSRAARVRTPAVTESDTASRTGDGDDSQRRLSVAVLGRRDLRRRTRPARTAPHAGRQVQRGGHLRRVDPGAGRRRRLGIHLGRSRAVGSAELTLSGWERKWKMGNG